MEEKLEWMRVLTSLVSPEGPPPAVPMAQHFSHRLAEADAAGAEANVGWSAVAEGVRLQGMKQEAAARAAFERALDVPHTAFLHRGLFRGGRDPIEIKAIVTRSPGSVQVEFVGEPRPPGLVARLLSPSGGVVTHFDRFLMPSVAAVEYRLGDENHFRITGYCTPISSTQTAVFSSVDFNLRIPHWLVRPFIVPIAMRVFAQDAWVLKAQSETVASFGGEKFTSTAIDLIGGQVWRLMRRAEQGRLPDPDPEWSREVPLQV